MKILVAGPESCGKSTLCKELSEALNIPLLNEYARTYLEQKPKEYSYDLVDLKEIAAEHVKQVEKIPSKASYIFDTFLFNIKIWSLLKFKASIDWLDEEILKRPFDYILLCAPNLDWEEDPLRENEHNREVLLNMYKDELNKLNWDYHIIDALGRDRTKQALDIIKNPEKVPH